MCSQSNPPTSFANACLAKQLTRTDTSSHVSPGVHWLRVELVVQSSCGITLVPEDHAEAVVPGHGPSELDQLLHRPGQNRVHEGAETVGVPSTWHSAQEHFVLWAKLLLVAEPRSLPGLLDGLLGLGLKENVIAGHGPKDQAKGLGQAGSAGQARDMRK